MLPKLRDFETKFKKNLHSNECLVGVRYSSQKYLRTSYTTHQSDNEYIQLVSHFNDFFVDYVKQ